MEAFRGEPPQSDLVRAALEAAGIRVVMPEGEGAALMLSYVPGMQTRIFIPRPDADTGRKIVDQVRRR